MDITSLSTKPVYTTGVAADITNTNPKTLINFENAKLTKVKRNRKGRRIYAERDLFDILLIKHLLTRKGMTYQGVKILLKVIKHNKEYNLKLLLRVISQKRFEKFLTRLHNV